MAKTDPKDLLVVIAYALENPHEALELIDRELKRRAALSRRLRRDPSLAKALVAAFPQIEAPAARQPRRRAKGG